MRPRPPHLAAALAALAVLMLLCAAVRIPALRDLPIFGDEAIFLRLAALIRKDPARNLWISLQAVAAPVHCWLLALALPLSADPVWAGRLLSVLAGILSVPALAWLSHRIATAFPSRESKEISDSRAVAITACILTMLSPFFAFAERMARVDALFVLEAILVSGASIGLASAAAGTGGLARCGLGFGLLMGVTMLTRQAVSYVLWVLPVVALLLRCPDRRDPIRPALRRLGAALGLAIPVALAMWTPMLLVPGWPDQTTRIFHLAATRPPMAVAERAHLFLGNLAIAVASFWVYLTPPVFIAAIGSLIWLARSGRVTLLVFLLSWEAVLLAPAALFAVDFFPRYALPAAFPLLLGIALGLPSVCESLRRAVASPLGRRVIGTALLSGLLVWPVRDLLSALRDWRRTPLLPIDREQFVKGWSGGFATETAIAFLEHAAGGQPIAVVTPQVSGNPSDAVWLLLGSLKRIRLYYAVDPVGAPLLAPAESLGRYWLRGDIREGSPPAPVLVEPRAPVYFVAPDPFLTRAGWSPANDVFAVKNPGLREVARFENPGDANDPNRAAVVVFRLR